MLFESSYAEKRSSKNIIGEGSYGQVIQTQNLNHSEEMVAVKIIQPAWENDSLQFCLCLYREVFILRRLNHPNIVRLIEAKAPRYDSNSTEQYYSGGFDGSLNLLEYVFECADTDLHQYLSYRFRSDDPLSETESHSIMYQLLLATQYLHSANVIHRDIKPQNILIWGGNSLIVKLADFGLARVITPNTNSTSCNSPLSFEKPQSVSPILPIPQLVSHLTQHVVTRWYRAPEVILTQPYDKSLDIWSLGCVFADLLSCGKPLFPGRPVGMLSYDARRDSRNDDNNMLVKIFRVLGGPSDEEIAFFPENIQQILVDYQQIYREQVMINILIFFIFILYININI